MSLIANYQKLQKDLEQLKSAHAKMASDPELKREMEFDSKLRTLMGEYSKSLPDVISILEPASINFGKKSGSNTEAKKRRPRQVKVYHNPLTGERVESKGGNNKLLGQWKAEFGAEEVENWIEK